MRGELTIRWSGGERSFPPGTEVRIGRDPGGEVVLDNPNVSRIHVSIIHDGSGWVLRDQGSFQGTYKEGQAVTETRLGSSQVIVLGAPQLGEELEIAVVRDDSASTPSRGEEADGDALDTVVPSRTGARPGGELRQDAFEGATIVGGESLRAECGGKTYQFSPGRRIVVGRDPEADIVSANPTVSRSHAAITHDGDGWRIDDLDSRGGTFVDGRKTSSARLRGSTAVWLGDPEAGERVVLVAGGEKEAGPMDRFRRLSRSGMLGVAAVAVAVIAVVAASVALLTRDTTPTTPDLDQLAQGVVRIETSEGLVGSGTVLDAELGLILTSAHVVAPRAAGQGVIRSLPETDLGRNPTSISVWVSDGIDRAAEPRFRADVAEVDGYLDLAVLRITETIGGALIGEGDLDGLVAVDLGDADVVESGEPIRILGYPTLAQSNAATLTTGVLSSSVQDARLGSNRAYINLDADIRPGNSGGLVADGEGRIIGVPTLNWVQDSVAGIGAMRPIGFAIPLLEAARSGEPYVSGHLESLTGDEEIPSLRVGQGAEPGFREGCDAPLRGAGTGDRGLSLELEYSGFAPGRHQDLAVAIVEGGSGRVIGWANAPWPFRFAESGCFTVGLTLSRPLEEGRYLIELLLGPNYQFDEELAYVFDLEG